MLFKYSFGYSIPYLLLAVILLILAWREQQWRKSSLNGLKFYLSALVFLIFFGFRGFVGWDWRSYYPYFMDAPSLWDGPFAVWKYFQEGRMEPGFTLWISGWKSIWNNWHFFLFMTTAVDTEILFIFFRRYSCNIAFSFFLFIALHLAIEIDLLRNLKGLLLFYLAIRFLLERRLLPYSITVLIGGCFHYSILALLPLYFFIDREYPPKLLIPLFVFANILYLCKVFLIGPLIFLLLTKLGIFGEYLIYFEKSMVRGITAGYLFYLVTFLMVMMFYRELLQWNNPMKFFINSFLLYFFCYLVLADLSIVSNRLGLLLSYSFWILCPYLFFRLPEKLFRFGYALCLLGFCFIKLSLPSGTGNIMYRYDNLLSGNMMDYEERDDIQRIYAWEIQVEDKSGSN